MDPVSDFLLELRSEEIPARMQAGARASLERLFGAAMAAAGVPTGAITVWSTPRRLALIARDLPDATEPVSEELKGPRTGAPQQALEGFLRKTGFTQDQLTQRDGIWFAVREQPGRATREVLAEAIPAMVRGFDWPKSMRWGAASVSTESLRWVRPLSGIVAILGEDLVPCAVGPVVAGYATVGHRFHHPGAITIGGAHDYADKLRACHVLVDHAEREDLIRDGARKAAAAGGLTLIEDEGLVIENAGLTEWPVPLLGRFDEGFLQVPPEVIRLTARTNQKYFTCRDGSGALANAFVCTANIEAADDGAAIVAGNQKVLAARLADARFFWDQDRRKTLTEHATGLSRITFHEKLGTLADKVERVANLAEWLASEAIVPDCDPALARQAAELCKADLVTEMVGEFPELQGVIGGYYARSEGLDPQVADAIRDHYKPAGQGDEVPTAPVTVAVSLADKFDTIVGFFGAQEKPTGSRDPFALRRAALGVIQIILQNELRFDLSRVIWKAIGKHVNMQFYHEMPDDKYDQASQCLKDFGAGVLMESEVPDFFADRLKVQQREAGVRHDLIDAVFALGNEDDLVRLLARVHALQAFIATEDGANLLAAYKRAANILKKEAYTPAADTSAPPRTGEEDPYALVDDPDLGPTRAAKLRERARLSYSPEPEEKDLMDALYTASPRAAAAVEAEDFTGAMAALASLRAPIDAFFDKVTVNDADASKRNARLALLDRFRAAVHNVADFSKVEG